MYTKNVPGMLMKLLVGACMILIVSFTGCTTKSQLDGGTDGSAARRSLGQEAVTNTGDSTFDSGPSGRDGNPGRPNPCLTADCGRDPLAGPGSV